MYSCLRSSRFDCWFQELPSYCRGVTVVQLPLRKLDDFVSSHQGKSIKQHPITRASRIHCYSRGNQEGQCLVSASLQCPMTPVPYTCVFACPNSAGCSLDYYGTPGHLTINDPDDFCGERLEEPASAHRQEPSSCV